MFRMGFRRGFLTLDFASRMRCPFCHHDNDAVRDSRVVDDGKAIRRRRYCNSCRRRFTTYERVEGSLQVIKKNGDREPFDRSKIERGLELACWKRPVPASERLALIDSIEASLMERYDVEVSTRVIGGLCMEALAQLDQVAYVRFASVYREFKDVADFVDELRPMLDRD